MDQSVRASKPGSQVFPHQWALGSANSRHSEAALYMAPHSCQDDRDVRYRVIEVELPTHIDYFFLYFFLLHVFIISQTGISAVIMKTVVPVSGPY